VSRPSSRAEAADAVAGKPPILPHGCGRSYGDVALNPGGRLIDCRGLDRFMAFDEGTGVLTCEAGVTLRDITDVACRPGPDGSTWFLPVSPGTEQVTLGGAIANDVHGKNHHLFGTFGEHVLSLEIARSDGVFACSRSEKPELFHATIGGIGLTGLVLAATIQLRRVPGLNLECEDVRYGTLVEFIDLAAASESDWEYTAAWVDCLASGPSLGRGIFTRARHVAGSAARKGGLSLATVPTETPFSLANRLTLPVFNELYWRRLGWRKRMAHVGDYASVLRPLDTIGGWNRIYGPRGFYQFQSVTPLSEPDALRGLLTSIVSAGEGSMLSVLKSFAHRPPAGMLSFPQEGFTLALDFPNRGASTLALLARLEAIVVEAGGRLYPAKDGAMSAEAFRRGYPQLGSFRPLIDPSISSAFARRVKIIGPDRGH
jgi:FAD/FMN-containing dehydrogenase